MFYNWQMASKVDAIKYRKASPNLEALKDHVLKVWGGTSIGLYQQRPIRGGSQPSSHAFGAAWDYRYPNAKIGAVVTKWLVDNHAVLGVQAIHDYKGCRIWREGRGWKKQKPDQFGMGQAWASWLHIETNKEQWGNKTPIANRLALVVKP